MTNISTAQLVKIWTSCRESPRDTDTEREKQMKAEVERRYLRAIIDRAGQGDVEAAHCLTEHGLLDGGDH